MSSIFKHLRHIDELRARGFRLKLEDTAQTSSPWAIAVTKEDGAVAFEGRSVSAEGAILAAWEVLGDREVKPSGVVGDISKIRITRAAVEKLGELYARQTVPAIQALLAKSKPVDQRAVWPLLGRIRIRTDLPPSTYLLAPDRKGVFVLEPDRLRENSGHLVLVTFLRFNEEREHEARRLWPVEERAA